MKQILFNTAMVRAILDGRKTVTRRLIKPQPKVQLKQMPCGTEFDGLFFDGYTNEIVKPPYQPGDILYVRETWKEATRDPGGGGAALTDMYLYKADEPINTDGMMVETLYSYAKSGCAYLLAGDGCAGGAVMEYDKQ